LQFTFLGASGWLILIWLIAPRGLGELRSWFGAVTSALLVGHVAIWLAGLSSYFESALARTVYAAVHRYFDHFLLLNYDTAMTSGTLITLGAVMLTVVPRTTLRRVQEVSPVNGRLIAWIGGIALCLLWSAAIVWYVWLSSAPPPYEPIGSVNAHRVYVQEIFVVPISAVLLLSLLASSISVVLRLPDRRTLSVLAMTTVPLAMLAPMQEYSGLLPAVARICVPMCASAVVTVSLAQLLSVALRERPLRRRTAAGIALLSSINAVPLGKIRWNWDLLEQLLFRFDGILSMVALILLAACLKAGSRDHLAGNLPMRTLGKGYRRAHLVGLACALIVLSRAYSFAYPPPPTALFAALLGAMVLMPSKEIAAALRAARLTPERRYSLVERAVRRAEARGMWSEMRKGLRSKVATNDLSFATAQAHLREVEKHAGIGAEGHLHRVVFGQLGEPDAVRRAIWGLKVGTALGLPWMAFSIYESWPRTANR
jgi:hypothetical protein